MLHRQLPSPKVCVLFQSIRLLAVEVSKLTIDGGFLARLFRYGLTELIHIAAWCK